LAAFAQPIPVGDGAPPPWHVPASTVRVITIGGMAGWQITLTALAAAVLVDRKLAGRRSATATAARCAP
jgi:hypothetical protein